MILHFIRVIAILQIETGVFEAVGIVDEDEAVATFMEIDKKTIDIGKKTIDQPKHNHPLVLRTLLIPMETQHVVKFVDRSTITIVTVQMLIKGSYL